MKINLTNKYVPNVAGVLRDLFIESCKMQGLTQQSNITLTSGSYLTVGYGSYYSTDTRSGLTLFSIQQTPSWNNKCPKDFTREEALQFVTDCYNSIEIEYDHPSGWLDLNTELPFSIHSKYKVRLKHSHQTKLNELEETIKIAQKQLEELKAIK